MTDRSQSLYKTSMPIKLFIVENHWMYREALVSALGCQPDIEILGAEADATAGLDRAYQLKHDVVIMDIRFKGEDAGILATAMLKKKPAGNQGYHFQRTSG